jgi:putative membrane protein
MLFRWLALTIAVWVSTCIVPGVKYDSLQDLLIAALILGLLNALVKPLLQLISLPFILLSLGLFLLVINAAVLGLTAKLVPGFHVGGFWSAVWGSLVISLVSFFLGVSNNRPQRRQRVVFRQPPPSRDPPAGPPPGKGPIIDIDAETK